VTGEAAPVSQRVTRRRPVSATLTPTPMIDAPPAAPTTSTLRGERANQVRTDEAAIAQHVSETRAIAIAIAAGRFAAPTAPVATTAGQAGRAGP
jgi:hypothetical protein